MKILIITPTITYPPTKGYEVMLLKHVEQLSTRHAIDIVSFQTSNTLKPASTFIENICDNLYTIKLSKWDSIINSLIGLFSTDPLQVRYYRSEKMVKLVNSFLKETEYDVVVFTLIRMAQYLPKWYKGNTILNMVDPLIFNYERSLSWRPWYMKLILKQEILRLKKYESTYSKLFSKITLIAEADITEYSSLLNNRIIDWVPYGIDVDYFKPDDTIKREPGMIIISGNMGYPPNVDGVKYFCQHVFPFVLKKAPTAHLWIVGINPGKDILDLGNHTNITVTGYVNDIRTYLNRAMVSVCPIRLRVGTQTKVLEALSMKTPVVTTPEGNHGVCGTNKLNLYVEDAPEAIAEKIISLLNGYNWDEMANNGRNLVVEKFRWNISVSKFEDILKTLNKS